MRRLFEVVVFGCRDGGTCWSVEEEKKGKGRGKQRKEGEASMECKVITERMVWDVMPSNGQQFE